jgi:hypothetical protein
MMFWGSGTDVGIGAYGFRRVDVGGRERECVSRIGTRYCWCSWVLRRL